MEGRLAGQTRQFVLWVTMSPGESRCVRVRNVLRDVL